MEMFTDTHTAADSEFSHASHDPTGLILFVTVFSFVNLLLYCLSCNKESHIVKYLCML